MYDPNNPDHLLLEVQLQQRWDERRRAGPPARFVTLGYQRSFTWAEANALSHGLVPGCMDDRWFAILRARTLDFYRSWTGIHVYCLEVQRAAGGMEAGPLLVNDDPQQHRRGPDAEELALFNRLLGWILEGSLAGVRCRAPVNRRLTEH
jgi:hypothetical protein